MTNNDGMDGRTDRRTTTVTKVRPLFKCGRLKTNNDQVHEADKDVQNVQEKKQIQTSYCF